MTFLAAPSCVMGLCRDDPVRPLVVTRVRICAKCQETKGETGRLELWAKLNGFGSETWTHGLCGECLTAELMSAGLSRQEASRAVQRLLT
jgi:hypothetical protein